MDTRRNYEIGAVYIYKIYPLIVKILSKDKVMIISWSMYPSYMGVCLTNYLPFMGLENDWDKL